MSLKIRICMGSSCFRRGNRKNLEFIEQYIDDHGCAAEVELVGSRCEEECRKGPNLQINGKMYHEVNLEMLSELIQQYLSNNSGE
ncbi:MAG: (2Fe-2S) ferredoxin domain-containing protein [Geobacteraceae bacterium]|nr:(2Fe-2S) ferredoxin domain-containing protein [Geobacteraceae bacterium]